MKRLLISGVAIAAMAAAAPALAADMPVAPAYKAPIVAPPAPTWAGCYAGLHAGYAWGDAEQKPTGRHLDPDGWLAGGQIGCNWQTHPSWVWGIEADLAAAGIKDSKNFLPFLSIKQDIDWLASIRGRAGFTNGPGLLYVTGGWGWAGAERRTVLFGETYKDDQTHDGWVLGVGYEHMFDHNWTWKIEYLYYDLGKATYYRAGDPVRPSIDLDLHTVKLGVNYKW